MGIIIARSAGDMWEIFSTRIDYVWTATINDVMAASAFHHPAGVVSNRPKTEPIQTLPLLWCQCVSLVIGASAQPGKYGLKARMQIAMNHNIHKPYEQSWITTLEGAADICGESRQEVIHALSFLVFSFYSLISAPLLWNLVEVELLFDLSVDVTTWRNVESWPPCADRPEPDTKRPQSHSNHSNVSGFVFKSELTQAVKI